MRHQVGAQRRAIKIDFYICNVVVFVSVFVFVFVSVFVFVFVSVFFSSPSMKCFEYIENLRGLKQGVRGWGAGRQNRFMSDFSSPLSAPAFVFSCTKFWFLVLKRITQAFIFQRIIQKHRKDCETAQKKVSLNCLHCLCAVCIFCSVTLG